ncbi:MAG: carboxylesterase family protein [Treponema sp.]|nr:carboxylesterase family protein [Treponema sp.]
MNSYTHSKTSRTFHAPMSEDCLYLNVWKPASSMAGFCSKRRTSYGLWTDL